MKNTNVYKDYKDGGGKVFDFSPLDDHNDADDFLLPPESVPHRRRTGRNSRVSLGGTDLLDELGSSF